MSQWLPIDSAPKDGTEVDLWIINQEGQAWRVTDARYVYQKDKYDRDGWWAPNCGYPGEDGFCDQPEYFNAHPRQNRKFFTKPTHWMPVPEQPT